MMSKRNGSAQNQGKLKWEKPYLMTLKKTITIGNGCGIGSGNVDCFVGNFALFDCFAGNGF